MMAPAGETFIKMLICCIIVCDISIISANNPTNGGGHAAVGGSGSTDATKTIHTNMKERNIIEAPATRSSTLPRSRTSTTAALPVTTAPSSTGPIALDKGSDINDSSNQRNTLKTVSEKLDYGKETTTSKVTKRPDAPTASKTM